MAQGTLVPSRVAQAIGATVGAYLVQHLEPHRLQFAIATSLLVVFILMVTPLAKLLKHWKAARAPKEGVKEPLLPESGDEKGEPSLSGQRLTTCKLPSTPLLLLKATPSEAAQALEGCGGAKARPEEAAAACEWGRTGGLPTCLWMISGTYLVRSLCQLPAVNCLEDASHCKRLLWLATEEAEGRSWREWLGLGLGQKGSEQQGGKEGEHGPSTGLAQRTDGSARKPASAFADMSQRQAACRTCMPVC